MAKKKKEAGDTRVQESYQNAANLFRNAIWTAAGVGGVAAMTVPGVRCKVIPAAKDLLLKIAREGQRPLSIIDSTLGKRKGDLLKKTTLLRKKLKGASPEEVIKVRKQIQDEWDSYRQDPLVETDSLIRRHNEEVTMAKLNFNKHKTNLLRLYEEGKIPSPSFGKGDDVLASRIIEKEIEFNKLKAKYGKTNSVEKQKELKQLETELKRMKKMKVVNPESFDAKVSELLGKEIQANTLIGVDIQGNKTQTIRDIIQETGSSGNLKLDAFLEEYGDGGLEALETIARAFREGGKIVGLPPERFLGAYYPKLERMLSKIIDNIGKNSPATLDQFQLKQNFEQFKRAFFLNPRTNKAFDGTDVSILEALQRYEAGIDKALGQELFTKIADARVSGAFDDYHETVGKSMDRLLKDMVELKDEPDMFSRGIDYLRNRFYASTLTNSIPSVLNNYTQLLNIVATEHGYAKTIQAMREVMKGNKSKFAPLIEAMDISPERALVSALDIVNLHGDSPISIVDKSKDLFAKSEAYMQSVAAITSLLKRFEGDPKALDALLSSNKTDDLFEAAMIAREGIMDTMFTNVRLNRSLLDRNPLGRAATTFLRHQLRETRFVARLAEDMMTGKRQTRLQATEKFSKYLLHKTIIMGGNSPWIFIPRVMKDYMDKNVPEATEAIWQLQFLINSTPLNFVHGALGAVNVDLSERQGLLDAFDFFYGQNGLMKASTRNIPIAGEISDISDTMFGKGGALDFSGDADVKKMIKAVTYGLAYAPGSYKFNMGPVKIEAGNGVVKFNGIPIGTKQIRRILSSFVDITEKNAVFFGEDRPIGENWVDKAKIASEAFAPSPSQNTIIRKKTGRGPKNTLAGLVIDNERSPEVFEEYVKEYGGDKKKAIKILKAQTTRLTKEKFAFDKNLEKLVKENGKRIDRFYKR